MARTGKCPICNRSWPLERLEIYVKGKKWYVYVCQECLNKITKELVEQF